MLEALERKRVPFHDHHGPIVGHAVERSRKKKPRRAEVIYAPGRPSIAGGAGRPRGGVTVAALWGRKWAEG